MMTTISIISEAQAKLWQNEVERLNEETQQLLLEVGEALQQVKDDADSTIVDEIYDWGTRIVTGTTKIFQGMNEILGTVTGILAKMKDVLETGKNVVKNAIKGIGGLF